MFVMCVEITKGGQDKILPLIPEFIVRDKININELATFSVKTTAGD